MEINAASDSTPGGPQPRAGPGRGVAEGLGATPIGARSDRLDLQGRMAGPAGRANPPSPDDYGLRGRPWMAEIGGPRAARSAPAPVTAPASPGTYTPGAITFADLAARVRTPEQVAAYLSGSGGSYGTNIRYDDDRLADTMGLQGYLGAYSSEELLARGQGVCRDTHALARDLLVANGYEAETLGYLAATQNHAVTAYKDPKSGYWGIIEYDTYYPPEQLKAATAEEAILAFRPNALVITHFQNNGPGKRSAIDGLLYMPAYRLFERFMAGPCPGTATGVSASNQGAGATFELGDGTQAALQVLADPRFPGLKGAVMLGVWKTSADGGLRAGGGVGVIPQSTTHEIGSNEATKAAAAFGFLALEEHHPALLAKKDLLGSGVEAGISSHTSLQAALCQDMALSGALSSLKWNPEVYLERGFDLWSTPGQDTSLRLAYGANLNGGLLATHYFTGGRGCPVDQYVSGRVVTRPAEWLGLGLHGYAPITHHTNDVAAEPLGRLELCLPYVRAGATAGRYTARCDGGVALPTPLGDVGLFGGAEYDRRTRRVAPLIGGQLSCTW